MLELEAVAVAAVRLRAAAAAAAAAAAGAALRSASRSTLGCQYGFINYSQPHNIEWLDNHLHIDTVSG